MFATLTKKITTTTTGQYILYGRYICSRTKDPEYNWSYNLIKSQSKYCTIENSGNRKDFFLTTMNKANCAKQNNARTKFRGKDRNIWITKWSHKEENGKLNIKKASEKCKVKRKFQWEEI